MASIATPDSQDTLHAPMPKRQLGSTGWEASLLTLGGVKWDAHCTEAEAIAIIHRALELGVNTFDTAVAYSDGESERRLGLALEGRRDDLWINTKTIKRDYDGARRDLDGSMQRLRTERIDLLFIHANDDDADYAKITADNSVLKALDEYRAAGHIRFIGVSGHWYKHNMAKLIDNVDLDAVLLPAGLFNEAYGYSYFDEVVPKARQKNMAVLGMKVFGAGRVKQADSIEPYLRYSLNKPIDTAVIGCDNVAQLEQTVRIVKRRPPALPEAEATALHEEARRITQSWDKGEFNWVQHYI